MQERVELHLHTSSSEDVSFITPKDVIETAVKMGHKAVAVTCRNSVQDFPELEACQRKYGKDIKIIYGAEVFYLKDDTAYGIALLAKNKAGLKGLYRILSSLRKWGSRMVVDWNLIAAHRKNLLCGAMTWVASELDGPLEKLRYDDLSLFDYIAISPMEYSMVSEQVWHRQLYSIAKKHQIPVVAVGNCHYITARDSICKKLIERIRFGYADDTLYHFRTTGEMLREFSYLGKEAAYEVVVTNPNLIAQNIEWVYPIEGPYPKFTLPHAIESVRELCDKKLYLLYAENIPAEVTKRLEAEFAMLQEEEHASIYLLAHHIADYLHDKGVCFGVRGTVGSTLIAYLLGISDTNPLPAHYCCPHCAHREFHVSAVSGYDLPRKPCPKCGAVMYGDGHNIPYEADMGVLPGDRQPLLALNIPDELRSDVLEFIKQLLGENHVAYAGALGRIRKYLADAYIEVYRDAHGEISIEEEARIAEKLCTVKNSEGMHPGGIVLLPEGMEFEDITPIRKLNEPIHSMDQVTHMNFYDISAVIPKIDVISHEDYSRLTALFIATNTTPEDINYNDPKIYSMLCQSDTAGLVDFSSPLAKSLVGRILPRSFSELVKISGMLHGAGAWQDNGDRFLEEHPFGALIGDRDDIFQTLQNHGIDRETAYAVTEAVGKGRVNFEENRALMQSLSHTDIPEWYIESMKKIRYLFPKAHLAAYCKLSVALAWFKLYYPQEFCQFELKE